MNRRTTWLLLIICGLCNISLSVYPRIKIVGGWDLRPLSYIDEDRQPTGLSVEITEHLLKKLNIPYDIKLEYKVDAYQDILEGKADLTWGTTTTADKKGLIHSSQNITYLVPSIAFRNGTKYNTDYNLLKNSKYIIDHINNDSTSYDEIKKSMYEIANGERKQVMWSSIGLQYLRRTYHFNNISIEPLQNIPSYNYTFVSNDKTLLHRLDSVYIIEKMNGNLLSIYNKWLYPERDIKIVPNWVFKVIWIVGAILAIMIIFNLISRIIIKKANKDVKQRSDRIKLALNSGNVILWSYDVKEKKFYTYNNKGIKKLHSSEEELSNHLDKNDYEIIKRKLRLLAEQKSDFETHIYRADYNNNYEKARMYSTSACILEYDKDGKPNFLLGTIKDITVSYEHVSTEKDMMLRYSTIFRSSMVVSAQVDKDGYYMDVNDLWCNFFGFNNKDEMLKEKLNITDIWGNFLIDKVHNPYKGMEIVDFDRLKKEYEVKTKRNGIFYIEHRIIPIYNDNGEYNGFYSNFVDVTEKNNALQKVSDYVEKTKEAKDDIERCAERMNQIIASGDIFIFSFNPKSLFFNISDNIINYSNRMLRSSWLNSLTDDSRKIAEDYLERIDNGMNDFFSLDFDVKEDNVIKHYEVMGMPEYNADGKVFRYFGITRDITKLVETQKMMEKKKKEAEKADLLKSSFIKNMSFEIRTPLQDIIGFAGLLCTASDKEEHEFFVKEISNSTNRLLRLVNHILSLSKFDAGMVEVKNKETDFSILFDEKCELAKYNIKEKEINFITNNGYSKCVVFIDDKLAAVVLDKILDNAIRYTENGYVKAGFEYAKNEITICIEDTGMGIAEENREKLFDRFFKTENCSFCEGLGLSFCNEILKLIGGSISFESKLGKGTTFTVTIPCKGIKIEKKN